ncbi:hypothetical protein AXG93_4776s1290 [Marchantia polymorpha subsp. ruderalis]|uniref:Uncharacterized protein n=1 Tax=Marchantia polymorpha subsp. ruderalis TaxID=1480154 RepID=A0A176VSA4_MARPO|nr:hypothetical protein AXG93_4776s1290 [Marchantia polymorpha subsp. ruderalis]
MHTLLIPAIDAADCTRIPRVDSVPYSQSSTVVRWARNEGGGPELDGHRTGARRRCMVGRAAHGRIVAMNHGTTGEAQRRRDETRGEADARRDERGWRVIGSEGWALVAPLSPLRVEQGLEPKHSSSSDQSPHPGGVEENLALDPPLLLPTGILGTLYPSLQSGN